MTDTLTVLQGELVACKRVTPAGVLPAPKQVWFRADQAQVSSLDELVPVLELVSRDPRCFVVRGLARDERIRRTHVGPEACLTDTPHQWFALDLDSVRPDLSGPEFARAVHEHAAWARQALGSSWAEAACWYQATGSAGLKPGIRLRLMFWLDQALDSRQAKALARTLPLPVDLALYSPSQPMYTSPPVFEGVPDPVQARSGTLPGEPMVRLDTGSEPGLERALQAIARAPEGERRNTLNAQAYALARTTDLPETRLAQALTQAALDSGLPPEEVQVTVQAALRDGRAKRLVDMDGWRGELVRDKAGNPRACAGNAFLYVLHAPALVGRLALVGSTPVWTEPPPWDTDPRPVRDADVQELVLWFQSQAGLSMSSSWCGEALALAASRNPINPVQEYLQALPEWDGKERVDTFFSRHWGVPDTRLTRAQSRIWFVQAARRPFATLSEPVQAQYLIVLQGPGGLRKSLGVRALCPRESWFRDSVPDLRDKDSSMAMIDSWLVELAELTHKRADSDVFKAFLTRTVEKFRPPYGRTMIQVPRQCALIGTCNEPTFLSDPTGNRRFWPLTCTRQANLAAIQAERDQLWAEARARAEEQTWLSDDLEAEAALVQEAHRDLTPEDMIQERLVTALQDPRFSPDPSLIALVELDGDVLKYVSFRLVCALAGLDPTRSGVWVGRAMSLLGWPKTRMRLGSGEHAVNRWEVPMSLRPRVRVQAGARTWS